MYLVGSEMRVPRFPRNTILIVAAFTIGIVVSGFILGLALYAQYPSGFTTFREAGGEFKTIVEALSASASESYGGQSAAEWREEPLAELETLNRMIIYTAQLDLTVGNVDSAMNEIGNMAESLGGFVSGASTSKRDGRRTGVITVRVPQKDFHSTILAIEELGEIESKDVKGEDVTEQYVDLEARLSNLQSQEQRLTEILDLCETVEEVLKVESELNRLRGEIERLTGQIQYLEARVDLATITVLLSEDRPWVEIPHVDWGAAIKAGLWGMFTVLQGLVALAIGVTPFVAIGTPVYYVYRRKQTKSETPKE